LRRRILLAAYNFKRQQGFYRCDDDDVPIYL
jgi:hypothetical protein